MRQLAWFVQLCCLWHVIKIMKTQGETLSKGNTFQLKKHPAVKTDFSVIIKNASKICYDNNGTHDDTDIETANSSSSSSNGNNIAQIYNIVQNILEQTERSECEQITRQLKQQTHFGFLQFEKEKKHDGAQYEVQPFRILQLRLPEENGNMLPKKQQQQLSLQEQTNTLKLKDLMQHLNVEDLSKANKKKKKRKKKKQMKKKQMKKRKKIKQKPSAAPQTPLFVQPAHILYASPTQKPLQYLQQNVDHNYNKATTKKPSIHHPLSPIENIKYLLRKNTMFKRKKKEYLNHLKHVLYPFIKFIAFFTIINPFTLAVFLFSLISPVVVGFLGFVGLSFFIKPALSLLFGVKRTVNAIKRKKLLEQRRRQRLRDSRRPITIHKHYYQQKVIAPPRTTRNRYPSGSLVPLKPNSPPLNPPLRHGNHHRHRQRIESFNPLLPDVGQKLQKHNHFISKFKGYNDSFERF